MLRGRPSRSTAVLRCRSVVKSRSAVCACGDEDSRAALLNTVAFQSNINCLRFITILRPFFQVPYICVSQCSHKGETYWKNHWIFMSQMSFLKLKILCQSTTIQPSGLVVFALQIWYQHPMSNQQRHSTKGN